MGRLFTTRRSEWLPGVAFLGASAGVAAALGLAVDVRWAVYTGLAALFFFLSGIARRLRAARRDLKAPTRTPAKPKPIPLAKPPYDLENDQSTDNQKYLM